METTPRFDVYIGREDTALETSDVTLLRTVDEAGSLNAAADELGRSFAHALRRIEELESAFGPLVERHTGGPGGGGSELTDNARELLSMFDRLQTGFEGVAEVATTVLPGTVVARDGELATVETAAGAVRAFVPEGDGEIELLIRADAVTLTDPDDTPVPEATSARNRFNGEVVEIDSGETITRVAVDVGAETPVLALVTQRSRDHLSLTPGREVVVSFKATATRGLPA